MKTKSDSFQARNEARFSFAVLLCAALVLPTVQAAAAWNPATESPYSFGPEGRSIGDIIEFAKPNQMTNFLPNRPISARDKYGNRVFFSGDGKMTVSISRDGRMTFSTKGMTIEKDAQGNLVKTKQNVKGTNKVEIRNEKGEILGYETVGFGGKALQEYDAQGNLTKTNTYDAYGKVLQVSLDELSLAKTEFDKNGNPVLDRDFEGAVVSRYTLDDSGRVQSKKDVYGNVTHFGTDGNLTFTENHFGQKLAEYTYKMDDEGRSILDFVEDVSPGEYSGDRTYYRNGKAAYTLSRLGGVAREYKYDGTTLVYTFDTRTNETTWYDINGKSICNTFNEYRTGEWLYYKSRLVGYFDAAQNTVTMFQYERQDRTARIFTADSKPTAKDIESYYESMGMMAGVGSLDVDAESGRKAPVRFNNIVAADNKSLAKTDFTTVNEAPSPDSADRYALVDAKYSYANGKLDSVLLRDPQNANGYITQIFIGEVTSGHNNRTTITVGGDQRTNTELYGKLWDAVISGGQDISDISSGNTGLSEAARSVISIDATASALSGLSDSQICNLFGWNPNGSLTGAAVQDVRARISNAGRDGTVSVVFTFDGQGTGNRIYASAVSAATTDKFLAAGTIPGSRLDLTTPQAHASLISANAPLPEFASGINTAPDDSSNPLVKTVNGVTRTYRDNGTIVSEVNHNTNTTTYYDKFNRKTEEYDADNLLAASYAYGADGKLQSTVSRGQDGYVTTFYIGWGVTGKDQTQITVLGDQANNTQLAQQLWNALDKGGNIADISSGNTELASFAGSVRSIKISPVVMARISDQQLCSMLGWDMAAPGTSGYLSQIRAMKPGLEGSFAVSYGYAGNDTPIYATRVDAANITNTVVEHIDLSSRSEHDKVIIK